MLGPGEIKGSNVIAAKQISDTVAVKSAPCTSQRIYTRDLQETNIMVETTRRAVQGVLYRPRGFPPRREGLVGSQGHEPGASRSQHRAISMRAARLDFLYSYLGHKPDRATAPQAIAEVNAARESIDRRKRRGAPTAKPVVAPLARRDTLVPFSIRIREYDHHTEQVHAAGGSWVRDVMLGLNDDWSRRSRSRRASPQRSSPATRR